MRSAKPTCFCGLFVQRDHAVLGVDHRHHRVQAVVLGDVVVHEEGLAHWAGVGHAGGFQDDALEVQLAGLALGAQVGQRAHQVAADRAADAAVGQLDDFLVAVLHQQVVVDAFRSEFVFDDRDAAAMEFGQDALEQGGLARTEAGEDGDGNHFVQTARGVHGEAACVKLNRQGLGGRPSGAACGDRQVGVPVDVSRSFADCRHCDCQDAVRLLARQGRQAGAAIGAATCRMSFCHGLRRPPMATGRRITAQSGAGANPGITRAGARPDRGCTPSSIGRYHYLGAVCPVSRVGEVMGRFTPAPAAPTPSACGTSPRGAAADRRSSSARPRWEACAMHAAAIGVDADCKIKGRIVRPCRCCCRTVLSAGGCGGRRRRAASAGTAGRARGSRFRGWPA